MASLALVFIPEDGGKAWPKWVEGFLKSNDTFHILFFGYFESLKQRYSGFLDALDKDRFDYIHLNLSSSLTSQANLVLLESKRLLPESIILVFHNRFPAALFEELSLRLNEPTSNIWEHQPNLSIYDPNLGDSFYQNQDDEYHLTNKNSDITLSWKDLEFNRGLLDEEELDRVREAVLTSRNVLITGDIGMGKTLLARYIHYHTAQTAYGNFVELNAAAIPETLAESLLFGIEQGVATDINKYTGYIESADGGTLFLDEIAETSKSFQAKLLRIISETNEPINLVPIGGRTRDVDVRFIAATNVNRDKLFEKMRKDLFSRFPIVINIKNLYDKKTEPFDFFLRAIQHFTVIDLRGNPDRIPKWDNQALRKLFDQKMLPDSLRELHNFVIRIWSKRRFSKIPWQPVVLIDEMKSSIDNNERYPVDARDTSLEGIRDVKSLQSLLNNYSSAGALDGLQQLDESEVQQLIFQTKRLALDLACWFSPSNKDRAKTVYGGATSSYQVFKKLIDNPWALHPNKTLRKKVKPVPFGPASSPSENTD